MKGDEVSHAGHDRGAGSVYEIPRSNENDPHGSQERDAAKPIQEVGSQEKSKTNQDHKRKCLTKTLWMTTL